MNFANAVTIVKRSFLKRSIPLHVMNFLDAIILIQKSWKTKYYKKFEYKEYCKYCNCFLSPNISNKQIVKSFINKGHIIREIEQCNKCKQIIMVWCSKKCFCK